MSKIFIDSEINKLNRVLIHSPDSGLGKILPKQAKRFLYEGLIDIDILRRCEYDYYVKLLLYFLDPDKIKGRLKKIDNDRSFYKPLNKNYFKSEKVIEIETLLSDICATDHIKKELIAAVCSVEQINYKLQKKLENLSPSQITSTIITGSLESGELIFPQVPSFIFTRDLAVIIKDHIVLNKPAKSIRQRESIMMKYIFYHHPYFKDYIDNIIELNSDDDIKINLDGGDFMMINSDHLIIGCNERTSPGSIEILMQILFDNKLVSKISVITLPGVVKDMHLDTIFSHVKKNTWLLYDGISKRFKNNNKNYFLKTNTENKFVKIDQFINHDGKISSRKFNDLEELLTFISVYEFKTDTNVKFIYSGNLKFPFSQREQWSESCNILALQEGVVLGYDRNIQTAKAFKKAGFDIFTCKEIINLFEYDNLDPKSLKNTLITMPSGELSRAKGGPHCLGMPIMRL